MNKVYLEGYINVGQYGGENITASGKKYTRFQVASGKGENRMYFNCTVWHDVYKTERGVVDGKYALIDAYPRAWKTDAKSGVDFTVNRIWWSPDLGGDAPKEEAYADKDVPF